MIQEIELKEEKRLAMVLDRKTTLEDVELYKQGLLDLAAYAATQMEENPDIEPAGVGWGIMYAINVA